MNESDVKRKMIRSMKESGGYGRRLEDQFAVGLYDLILIPKGLPVFTAEVKVFKGATFSPTPRQLVELRDIREVAADAGHVIPTMIGWRDGIYYFYKPTLNINYRDCFSITTSDVSFHDQLVQYYYSTRE
jgi:hypothetical protein